MQIVMIPSPKHPEKPLILVELKNEVFLGHSVEDNKKKQEAVRFKKANGIDNVKESYLRAKTKNTGKRNLLLCLDDFFVND